MWWRKRRSFEGYAAEIQSHLEHEADQAESEGESRARSERAARMSFGNVSSANERLYEAGGSMFWDRLAQDVRMALRLLRHRPAFSAVVILTLALGIGANSAIFSVIEAVLLRPLPYRDPARLGMIWSEDSAHGIAEGHVSLLNFADWKSRSHDFAAMTMFGPQTFLLGSPSGPPERMRSARVDACFFPMMGVEPLLGRVFTDPEERRGERVVVLSYRLWQSRFGGSTDAVGADLLMDGRKSKVIGVMPASFQYPFDNTEVWEPITAHPYWQRNRTSPRSDSPWFALGRLRADVTWPAAQKEMEKIGRQLAAEYPESKNLPDVRLVPLAKQTSGRYTRPLAMLFGAVCLLLLIASVNVANLMLARGSARAREFALRRALGAGRRTLAAQVLVESLVLSLAGSALGLVLAEAGLKALIAFGPRGIPRFAEARIDVPALLFTLALSLATAVISGLWPALRSGVEISRSRSWATAADRNVRNLLVASEFAIALVLVISAGLLVKSFVRLNSVDPGFRPANLLMATVDLHVGRTPEQQSGYFREAIAGVRTIPGVSAAAAVTSLVRSDPEEAVEIKGQPLHRPGPSYDSIEGPFFQTAGVPLLRGRLFSGQDRRGGPRVAIINEAAAKAFWPNDDPLGKQFRFPNHNEWITVVGVAGDMHRQGLEHDSAPQVFYPEAQATDNMMDIVVRTSVDAESIASLVRSEIQSLDMTVARFDVTTAERELGEETAERRFQTWLVALFSTIALALAGIGIYGLMHFLVTQRANEIGVRVALGARYGGVLALVFREALKLAGIGVIIGILGALVITRLLASLLYGTTPTDPLIFGAVPLVLLGVAAFASWVPAHRAAQIDPASVLRRD